VFLPPMLKLVIAIIDYFKERRSSFMPGISSIYRPSYDYRVGSKKSLGVFTRDWLHGYGLPFSLRMASLFAIILLHLQGYLGTPTPEEESQCPYTIGSISAPVFLLHCCGRFMLQRCQISLSLGWATYCVFPSLGLWLSMGLGTGPKPFGWAFKRGFTFDGQWTHILT
jgi:hypothetical protein